MEAMDAVGAVAPHADLSIWGLFWAADWIVKAVMIGLMGASIWCWAIIVDKTITYRRSSAEMNKFERMFWSGQSLEELYQQQSEKASGGMGAVFVAAMKEWKRSHEQNAASFAGMQQRLDKVLDVAISSPPALPSPAHTRPGSGVHAHRLSDQWRLSRHPELLQCGLCHQRQRRPMSSARRIQAS